MLDAFNFLTLFYHININCIDVRITKRNTSTIDTMFTLGKPFNGKNPTTSLDKILQQDTMSNLVPNASYRNIILIYKKDT